jgi:hypothetical protein
MRRRLFRLAAFSLLPLATTATIFASTHAGDRATAGIMPPVHAVTQV